MRWGKIEDIEPLFILERITKHKKEPIQLIMSESAILDAIRDAARLAGLSDWRAVTAISLRKVFNNFLINQKEKSGTQRRRTRIFYGSDLFQGTRDTYFDKTKIEEMRRKYSRLDFDPKLQKKKAKRIIDEIELDRYLKLGCDFVAVLPSGKILIVCEENLFRTSDTQIIKEEGQRKWQI